MTSSRTWIVLFLVLAALLATIAHASGLTEDLSRAIDHSWQVRLAGDRLRQRIESGTPSEAQESITELQALLGDQGEQHTRLSLLSRMVANSAASPAPGRQLVDDIERSESHSVDDSLSKLRSEQLRTQLLLQGECVAMLLVSILLMKLERAERAGLKTAENLAETRRRWFDALFEAAPQAACLVDGDRVTRLNPAATNLFGSGEHTLSELFPNGLAPDGERARTRIHKRGGTSLETQALSAFLPGAERVRLVLLADVEAEVRTEEQMREQADDFRRQRLAALNLVDDAIMSQKKLEALSAELRRSNEDLSQFAYVASHDLQEPLRAVSGCLQLLVARYSEELDPKAKELIQHSVEGSERMRALIRDLLEYARIDTRGGKMELIESRKSVDMALALLQAPLKESEGRVEMGELPSVRADQSQLMRLFQNLIGNALKYRGERIPEISVTATLADGFWTFAIRDNGIGIDPAYYDKVFGIFQRLHTRVEYPGTGIGLAVCRRIVERHGGKIWLESVPNEGTCFFFTLPAPDAQSAAEQCSVAQ